MALKSSEKPVTSIDELLSRLPDRDRRPSRACRVPRVGRSLSPEAWSPDAALARWSSSM